MGQLTMSPSQAWLMLRARQWLVLFVFTLIVGGATLGSLLWPKSYKGEASIVVDVSNPDLVTGNPKAVETASAYLATQIDVITSHSVALKVVDQLKLNDDPEIIQRFREKVHAAGSIRDWIANLLEGNLEIVPSRESSVVVIDYYARDPQIAAEIANAFADAYIATDRELKSDTARRQSGWFRGQNEDLRRNLEAAQNKLASYQRTNAMIANSPDRLDVESAHLTDITSQLVAAQGQLSDSQAKLRQLRQANGEDEIQQAPDILGNGLLQSMKADLTRAEGKLADTAQRLDRNHPQYIEAAAEVRELKRKLLAEIDNVSGAIKQSADISQQRVRELQSAVDQQKTRIIQLQQQKDAMNVLTADVQNAQRTYDAAMQRADSLTLEGRNDQSVVGILDRAVAPIAPARPRVFLIIAVALVLGAILSLGAAFAAEQIDRRVRTRQDLLNWTDMAVLAEIPRLLTGAPKRAVAA